MRRTMIYLSEIRERLENLIPQPYMYLKVPTARSVKHYGDLAYKLEFDETFVLPEEKVGEGMFPTEYMHYYRSWYPNKKKHAIPSEVLFEVVKKDKKWDMSHNAIVEWQRHMEQDQVYCSKWVKAMHTRFETAEITIIPKESGRRQQFEGDLLDEVRKSRDYLEQFNPNPEDYEYGCDGKYLTLTESLTHKITVQGTRYPIDYAEHLQQWYPARRKFSVPPRLVKHHLSEIHPRLFFPPERVIAAHLRELEESKWMLMMRERYNAVKS